MIMVAVPNIGVHVSRPASTMSYFRFARRDCLFARQRSLPLDRRALRPSDAYVRIRKEFSQQQRYSEADTLLGHAGPNNAAH
ncbi:hypothetical protein [Bradyrhizobium erythrophlei]|uniref:hypothetical protein n=1 Tax=Bradyrhizobium erythrophlei TaxID=1437360 RepID=UPI00115FB873|nr:hypothetical protein [Bradyrhizobium erythrophlei]